MCNITVIQRCTPPVFLNLDFQIDQTLETIHYNFILVLSQGVNKYLQLHQHYYTSHLLCHSNYLSQPSSLREQSLHIFSSTIMFNTGILLILHIFLEAPWCMLAENRNKLSNLAFLLLKDALRDPDKIVDLLFFELDIGRRS